MPRLHIKRMPDGTLFVLTDNGFGNKANSPGAMLFLSQFVLLKVTDFLKAKYFLKARWRLLIPRHGLKSPRTGIHAP